MTHGHIVGLYIPSNAKPRLVVVWQSIKVTSSNDPLSGKFQRPPQETLRIPSSATGPSLEYIREPTLQPPGVYSVLLTWYLL